MAESGITKNALAASMKKLMQEKDFSKISIQDICKDCGMNRKSFYYHFKDKYDLVNWIFYVDILGRMDLSSYQTGWDAIEDICTRFYEDRDFYRAALEIQGQNSVHDYILETIRTPVTYYISDIYKDEALEEFFTTFVCDAFLTAIMRWLSKGLKMTPEVFVANLKRVGVGLARQILENTHKYDVVEKND